jgi:hypothetical protein
LDTRQQRVAKNEALFREVNERIKDVNLALEGDHEHDFLCECGDDDCTAPISLTLAEYESVRADATHFAIVPGHDVPDVESVVSRNERFAIVEKQSPAAARIAVERDPRDGETM